MKSVVKPSRYLSTSGYESSLFMNIRFATYNRNDFILSATVVAVPTLLPLPSTAVPGLTVRW